MNPQERTKWSGAKCKLLLAAHWDDSTSTLDIAGITMSLGGENAAADFFAAVLRSRFLGWRVYAAAGLRGIISKHLDPETRWLAALWDHTIAYVSTDPDEMIEFLKLLRVANSDRVRQWSATRLFSLCNSGTEEELRIFAFQGLESLIKTGGLVYVKKFARQLEEMSRTDEDPRFQLAAEGILAFLHPPPVRAVANPIAPVSKTPNVIESLLLSRAKTLVSHKDFRGVDMIAVELEPSAILPPEFKSRHPPIRVLVGDLAELFPEDPYPQEIYPFLREWTENNPLRVQIFGPTGDISRRASATFITTLDNILDAINRTRGRDTEQSDLEVAALELLTNSSPHGNIGIPEANRQAAKTVLLSTEYTVRLMSTSAFEGLSSRLRQHQLPYTDQRNLVFVPFWEEGICCGGMAILSHYPLSHDVSATALMMLRMVVYELRLHLEQLGIDSKTIHGL